MFEEIISKNINGRTFWEYLTDQVFNPKCNLFFFKKDEKGEFIAYKINSVLFNVLLAHIGFGIKDKICLEEKFKMKFLGKTFVEISSYKDEGQY